MKLVLRNTSIGDVRLFEKLQGIVWIIKLKASWHLSICRLTLVKLRRIVYHVLPRFSPKHPQFVFYLNYPHFSPN